MTRIGPYLISGKAVLAPMAGVTDLPFRQVCREMGAALVTAEMAASNPQESLGTPLGGFLGPRQPPGTPGVS